MALQGSTLTGAYGRDYKSKAAAIADFEANKDFILNSFGSGSNKPINKDQLVQEGVTKVFIRYGKLRYSTEVRVQEDNVGASNARQNARYRDMGGRDEL